MATNRNGGMLRLIASRHDDDDDDDRQNENNRDWMGERGGENNVLGEIFISSLLSTRINQKLRTMILLHKIEPWRLAPLTGQCFSFPLSLRGFHRDSTAFELNNSINHGKITMSKYVYLFL